MSQPFHIDTTHSTFDDRIHHEANARGVVPFIQYAEAAYAAASGIRAVIGMVRRDVVDREVDDEPGLSPYDVDCLLGLAQFAALALREDADRLRTWAGKHFVQEGQQ
ncbi:MAG: hypothetical protein ACN6PF_20425 [Achromobacter veterisilvae]